MRFILHECSNKIERICITSKTMTISIFTLIMFALNTEFVVTMCCFVLLLFHCCCCAQKSAPLVGAKHIRLKKCTSTKNYEILIFSPNFTIMLPMTPKCITDLQNIKIPSSFPLFLLIFRDCNFYTCT